MTKYPINRTTQSPNRIQPILHAPWHCVGVPSTSQQLHGLVLNVLSGVVDSRMVCGSLSMLAGAVESDSVVSASLFTPSVNHSKANVVILLLKIHNIKGHNIISVTHLTRYIIRIWYYILLVLLVGTEHNSTKTLKIDTRNPLHHVYHHCGSHFICFYVFYSCLVCVCHIIINGYLLTYFLFSLTLHKSNTSLIIWLRLLIYTVA